MKTFQPCKGKSYCQDDGQRCLVCGRGFDEIQRTRELIDALAALAVEQSYENVEEFADYVARKVVKKVRHRQAEA